MRLIRLNIIKIYFCIFLCTNAFGAFGERDGADLSGFGPDYQLGYYDHSTGVAIIRFTSRHENRKSYTLPLMSNVLRVDFLKKEYVTIDKGYHISQINARSKSYISYKKGDNLIIRSLKDGDIVTTLTGKTTRVFWVDNHDVAIILNDDSIILYSGNEGIVAVEKYNNQRIRGFEMAEGYSDNAVLLALETYPDLHKKPPSGRSERYLAVFDKTGLRRVKGLPYLNVSPDGEYKVVFLNNPIEVEDHRLVLSKVEDNSIVGSYYTLSPIRGDWFMWSKCCLRVLQETALIRLSDGMLLHDTPYITQVGRSERERYKNPYPEDLAVDPSGYVLKWDFADKEFLVEDLSTGDDILTYAKFW